MSARLLAAMFALAIATPAVASETLRASKDFEVRDASEVRVKFPAGSLEITTSPDDQVHATMIARCKYGRNCARRAERIRLISDQRGRTLVVRLEGLHRISGSGLDITLRLQIPRDLAIDVDMGAGDLDVRGTESDMNLDLGAGDIEVRLPEQVVRSVRLDVGVGDVTMRASRGRVRPAGWLSKHINWDEGEGDARVRVHLGVGDASVMLD